VTAFALQTVALGTMGPVPARPGQCLPARSMGYELGRKARLSASRGPAADSVRIESRLERPGRYFRDALIFARYSAAFCITNA
jgi:hypothetical protein